MGRGIQHRLESSPKALYKVVWIQVTNEVGLLLSENDEGEYYFQCTSHQAFTKDDFSIYWKFKLFKI